jgi:Kef-type K+ transport system membrane component KefB
MDLSVLVGRLVLLLAIVMGLVAIKAIILYLLGRWCGLRNQAAVRLGLVISQSGEFAFVLFSAGALAGVIGHPFASLLNAWREPVNGRHADPGQALRSPAAILCGRRSCNGQG